MEGASELRPAPPKRPKTLAKDKGKMEPEPTVAVEGSPTAEWEEKEEEEGWETCGICFSDSGRSIRGRIDSCDHFFCFVCIMEWAKIESRCPLCKRRFQSIRRPPVDGVFLVERVVDVPVRDQVYHPLGNESTALSDLYAHVNCSICHGSQNEELLLLCDLCDSGAHTYCVGLGATVPEGDWYCPDCTISRDKHSKSQFGDDSCPQDSCKNVGSVQVPEQPISIYDIVADEITANSSRSFSTINDIEPQRTGRRSSRNSSHSETQDSGTLTVQSSLISTVGEPSSNPGKNTKTGARTLSNCRSLHDHIRTLRENWIALQAGSLHFSSNLSVVKRNKKRRSDPAGTSSNISRWQGTTSHINQEQTASSGVYSKTSNTRNLQDIDKAWRMMEIAKAARATGKDNKCDDFVNFPGKRNSVKGATNYPSKVNVLKGTEKLQSGSSTCNDKSPVGNRAFSTGLEDKCFAFRMYQNGNTQSDFKKTPDADKSSIDVQNFQGHHWKGELAPQLASCQSPTWPDPGSVACSQNCVSTLPSRKPISFSSSNVEANNKEINGNKTDLSLTSSDDRAKNNSSSKFQSLDKLIGNLPSTHVCGSSMKTNVTADNSSKSEIQSLVKLNLRLLNRDQQLGAARFKEVARIATHSILAACGLEHSKSSARSFTSSSPICRHSEQIKQLRQSKLMPSSCRECFYTFVQNVVNSVMIEKHLVQSPPD